ncbi:MAG: rod shape-determining protein MreD [Polyangiales bacterium]|jgi:rod shape-determining protein MreD
MNPGLRAVLIVGAGFVLLLVQSALSVVAPMFPFVPNVVLPAVLFLGVSQDVYITRGAGIAFGLGYLVDLFCGNLMSLHTFLCVATFLLARGMGLRLVLRAPGYQAGAAFFVAVLYGGASLTLRTVFGRSVPFPAGGYMETLWALLPQAVATAVVAPLVFLLVTRLEGVSAKRQEGATS